MPSRLNAMILVLFAGLTASLPGCTQADSPPQSEAVTDQGAAPAPAPFHDMSGTWEPANGPMDGGQFNGVKAMPNDGKPEHELPYTPLGLATYESHNALEGLDAVLPAFQNDPRNLCEPLGFPRTNHYNLRQTQILQNEFKVVVLYEYGQAWRVIWTDGREVPTDIVEPRFYGYSAGRWVDDTTLVVDTVGMMPEDRVWLDSTGRPISDAARVEERWHRASEDRLELSITIDDPKMYTRPWVSMDSFPMQLMDPHYDVPEMYCSPVEMTRYNELFGLGVSDVDNP